MERIVLDTNLLISAAILPKSASAQALFHAIEKFQLVHSEATWLEFSEVIARKKFDRYLTDTTRSEFILFIARASEFQSSSVSITDCADPKDNKFLELAIDARALLIVSGDTHLLDMHPYRNISILNPANFLATYRYVQ